MNFNTGFNKMQKYTIAYTAKYKFSMLTFPGHTDSRHWYWVKFACYMPDLLVWA